MDTRTRTADIASESRSFSDLLLPAHIVQGLAKLGFHRPTPVQHKALPVARLGVDVIVQAKSGTGKTLVFALLSVEKASADNSSPQVPCILPPSSDTHQKP